MTYSKHTIRNWAWACSAVAALALAGCGGGSDSNGDSNPTTPSNPDPVVPTNPSKPSAYYTDSIVLPASAIKAAAAPQALGAAVKTTYVVLPAIDTSKIEQDGYLKASTQIGTPRVVAATATVAKMQQALQWNTLADGRLVAAINIESTGAYGLRAGVAVERLPDNAVLRVYSQEHPNAVVETRGEQVNALLARNQQTGVTGAAAATWWTPEIGTGNATLEVVLPAGTRADALRIAIPTVSHVYQNLALPTADELAAVTKAGSGSCNLDASCTSDYQVESNAVARMLYTREDGKSYLCTGTLVNNVKGDYTPYFMTANHCISSQTSASSLQTAWFYRSSSCNSGVPGSNTATRYGGANLLYATADTDSSFLQLNEMPPAGVTLAGWDARVTTTSGAAVYGLHQPLGDLLKYSVGSVSGFLNCSASGIDVLCTVGNSNSNFYDVTWSQGVTEGGSSGSGLFKDGRLIGTLFGGSSSCTVRGGTDTYGRFDAVFNNQLWKWLAS